MPSSANLMNDEAPTIIFNCHQHNDEGQTKYHQINSDASAVHQIISSLYQQKIQSVLVEGGAQLLQSFIAEGMWDEARVITNDELIVDDGLAAPVLQGAIEYHKQKIMNDTIKFYKPNTK